MFNICVSICIFIILWLCTVCLYLLFILFVFVQVIFSFFFFNDTATTEIYTLSLHDALPILSLRSSRSSYFATFRHQLTILSKTDALDEEKWLNMLGTFVKDWFRYESHFVHGRDSLVDILKERGLLSESDAVQPLIGKKS